MTMTMTVAHAETRPATATIVRPANDPAGPGTVLLAGAAATPFSLQLPPGAACTRSSADANYRVQSFMVPATTDATTLTFGGDHTLPLYTVTGDPFVDAQTAQGQKNEPGYVVNVPAFNLALLGPNDAPAGTYAIGLACTKANELDRVWAAELDVDADRSWRVAASTAASVPGQVGSATTVASLTKRSDTTPSRVASSETRNAMPETPGGTPSVNVSVFPFPRWGAFALVLVALRLAFLFLRPRPPVMES